MGCRWSTGTAVRPLVRAEDGTGAEEETGNKLDGRGDSAVSKGTTDSGVVIEDGPIPVLPGEVPGKPPTLTSVADDDCDGRDDVQLQSRMILEELEHQGIIPVGQRGSVAGEAYSIMLDDGEAVRRRPPARLESLKATKEQSLPSREKCEEKMRVVEERRKLREDELRTRLRAKSARARAPTPAAVPEAGEDPPDPAPSGRAEREEAEGEERSRESPRDVRERGEEGETGGLKGGSEEGDGGEEEEELTQVVELMNELCDSTCQSPDDKETF